MRHFLLFNVTREIFPGFELKFFLPLNEKKLENQFYTFHVSVTNVLLQSLIFFPACGKLSELGVGVKVRIWEFVFSQKITDLDWFGFFAKKLIFYKTTSNLNGTKTQKFQRSLIFYLGFFIRH